MTDHHDFDAAMRHRHDDAVAHVSPRVQAQLQLRRRAVLSGNAAGARVSPLRRFGWAGAASFAAVLAVAIGMQYGLPGAPQGTTAPSASAAIASADDNDAGGDVALDENPDFYLWLGSNDAQAFAME